MITPAIFSFFLVGSASAFAPSATKGPGTALAGALEDLPGCTPPVGPFDPCNLATLGSESTLLWFRAAELKHGRVAMLATTGYLVQASGVHFPGMLSSDVSFESLSSMKPLDAWTAVPSSGQAQIIGMIALAEIISEAQGTHYLKGGDFPTIIFPPINFSGIDKADLKTKQSRELNNGRLAMIGIMSFIAEANVPGSVPLLSGNPIF